MEKDATLTHSHARRGHAPFWSSRRLQAIVFHAALILVEMLPVEAWLIVFAGNAGVGIGGVAVPLWYLVLAMGCASFVTWRFARPGVERVLLVGAPSFVAALLVLLRISPSAYGTIPLDLTGGGVRVFDPLLVDLAHGVRQLTSDVALSALLLYVWWRGILLGRASQSLVEVSQRFQWSMVAFILALLGFVSSGGSARASLFGAMAVMLPVEVFVGLTALALANASTVRERSRMRWTGATEGRLLGSALLLAGLVATLALVINIFINFESVSAMLRQLGPAGAGVDWLLNALKQLIIFVLDKPLQFIVHWVQVLVQFVTQHPRVRHNRVVVCPAHSPDPRCHAQHSQDTGVLDVTVVLIMVVIAAIIVGTIAGFVVLLHRIMAFHTLEDDAIVEEEREAIGGRGLFGAQVRALFGRRARKEAVVERLVPGTVRAVYRDVLRVAARVGMGRLENETPGEYGRRLVETPLVATSEAEHGDVVALSRAYERARYGGREPEREEQAALLVRGKRVSARLRGQQAPPGAR